MIDGDTFELCQRDAIELIGNGKGAFTYVFQFEVGLNLFFFEVIFLFTEFFRCSTTNPMLPVSLLCLLVHQLLQFGCFGFCFGGVHNSTSC